MFTSQDLHQIKHHGLQEDVVKEQLKMFKNGVPFTKTVRPALLNDGIESYDGKTQKELVAVYDSLKKKKDVIKFVPASGAATRMFKFLHTFLETYDPEESTLSAFIKATDSKPLHTFFFNIKYFPFIRQVRKEIRKNNPEYKKSKKGVRMQILVNVLLNKKGLNFAEYPKGLIPFHKYPKYTRTAFEEHLFEATQYATVDGVAHLHFTFSPDHINLFKNVFQKVQKRITKKTKVELRISYSFQDASTDTIAVTDDNVPFRDKNNALVFRPSGHGALLKNLNDVDADVIFIKNIDNVSTEAYSKETAFQKKMLAGKMLQLQRKIFSYLEIIVKQDVTQEKLNEMKTFLWNELHIRDIPETKAGIAELLNRPIRVCGVVKNTGAPGGGPFWVSKEDNLSLQIVELSQIDTQDPRQVLNVEDATHFNPVDLVCGTRDYKGKKFDLEHFVDSEACFVSSKTVQGSSIKALELPGLWNGAMANWNTIFVEVPFLTFNPVKTVNDLLQPMHRSNA